jgi:UDP-N-acetyl-D-galactosamine dehydrogenase
MNIQTIAVIGLGYVGLPLAVHLARANFYVHGVDINERLVQTLNNGLRPTTDLPKEVFPMPDTMRATTNVPKGCGIYIVCVPTPDIGGKKMDPTYVLDSCYAIGKVIGDGGIVVIESTVTPGATNGILRDAVAKAKGDYNFHIAFSPERVNPGSRYFYEMGNTEKLLGAPAECVEPLTEMYSRIFESVVVVGIEEAEIAKAFENTQRDMNIALMNELALKCYEKGISYSDVVKGLRTKKTSPVFSSGMVGGHCIPVDPYFLAEYYDDANCLALHGRAINENYIKLVAAAAIDCNTQKGPIVIVGRSYKEGVTDTRNSGSVKLLWQLGQLGGLAECHDPLVDPVYRGPKPTLIIGATNHHPTLNIFETYGCHEQCAFINIGGRFTEAQCKPFHKVVEL